MENLFENEFNIESVLGHVIEAELTLQGYFGSVKQTLVGRIIYSAYQGSLFFIPKGNRSKGYSINLSSIHNVKILKKDKKKHEEYLSFYIQREQIEKDINEISRLKREENERIRKERFEQERKIRKENREREINEAKILGGYDDLEKEVIVFYESYGMDTFSESFVKNTTVPLLNKLMNKGIENVNDYPKHYFDKKRNPRLCALIEKKLNIKLLNTQKGNVEKLNQYLIS